MNVCCKLCEEYSLYAEHATLLVTLNYELLLQAERFKKSLGGLAVLSTYPPSTVPILAGAIYVSKSNITISDSRTNREDLSAKEGKEVRRRQSLLIYLERLFKPRASSPSCLCTARIYTYVFNWFRWKNTAETSPQKMHPSGRVLRPITIPNGRYITFTLAMSTNEV